MMNTSEKTTLRRAAILKRSLFGMVFRGNLRKDIVAKRQMLACPVAGPPGV